MIGRTRMPARLQGTTQTHATPVVAAGEAAVAAAVKEEGETRRDPSRRWDLSGAIRVEYIGRAAEIIAIVRGCVMSFPVRPINVWDRLPIIQ